MTPSEIAPIPAPRRRPRAAANGMLARVLLAFLATAGLFYVNIMPALVDGLVAGLDFTKRDAGLVGSLNVYGAAVGAFAVVLVVKKLMWRKSAYALMLTLLLLDSLSMMITSPVLLMAMRFLHGVIGGALVGIGFSVIARTVDPDKTFGMLLLVQFGLGGVGVMYLPRLVPEYGTSVLFLSLIAFTLVTLLMLPFLDDYPVEPAPKATAGRIDKGPLALTLAALFLFQAANMGLYAYILPLAEAAGLGTEFTSRTLGQAAWVGILGSGLVVLFSTRFGRTLPLLLAIGLTAAGTWGLHLSAQEWVFWLANVGIGVTWAFVIPYLLGMAAAFDRHGQMAALGGFASKMGLASGPMAAALLVGEGNYGLLINLAVVALILCIAVMLPPARLLDRH
ncbi:MFS transporter [Ferrimonas gelatinilytica]|uniref:MFS transporter n=1 Tax=Ferrimonas gelatinilytica TaxID=1255257 RepID=A0ABP9S5R8_9GAMM